MELPPLLPEDGAEEDDDYASSDEDLPPAVAQGGDGSSDEEGEEGGQANPGNFADWEEDGGDGGGGGDAAAEPTLCLFDDRWAPSPEAALEQARARSLSRTPEPGAAAHAPAAPPSPEALSCVRLRTRVLGRSHRPFSPPAPPPQQKNRPCRRPGRSAGSTCAR